MLDTVKVAIPLTRGQHERIISKCSYKAQWVKWEPQTGEIQFVRKFGVVQTDGESFHREIRWDVDEVYRKGECFLTVEFSIPKLWYGHNIILLHDSLKGLNLLKELLEAEFGFKRRGKLPPAESWQVRRADICYAWNFHSDEKLAQRMLDCLKKIHYPRKHPVIRPHSIFFGGSTYSVKFYLKLPEFKVHDRKALLEQKAALEWINYLEDRAAGVLRFEVAMRRRYLRKAGFNTVGDLLQDKLKFVHDPPFPTDENEFKAWMFAINMNRIHAAGLDVQKAFDGEIAPEVLEDVLTWKPGDVFEMPGVKMQGKDREYLYPGGTLRIETTPNLFVLLMKFLTRLVGREVGLVKAEEVNLVLSKHFKQVKAARLTSFWLFVQKFGSARAREDFGDNSYYYNKRELKKAGVSLIEPPKGNLVNLDDFRFVIPSNYVVNAFDDFRDSGNLLNFKAR